MPAAKPQTALRPAPTPVLSPGIAVSIALFLAGLVVGWTVAGTDPAQSTVPAGDNAAIAGAVSQVRGRPTAHSHPLLFCDDASGAQRHAVLRTQVQVVLDKHLRSGALARAAVSVRDLETGAGFAIGGDDKYHPASLLKLPLAIAWMRKAEADPAALTRPLLYDMQTLRESAKATGALVTGQSYTAQDLLERMVRWSRNDAKAVLAREIGDAALKAVYDDLAITWPYDNPDADALLSVNDYSRLFRALYNASVLRADTADKLLQLLTRTEFPQALVAGLPAGTEFAHKWGMRTLQNPSGNERVHLHDCGIVYQPGRPLLLCAMSAGRSDPELAAVLAEVARTVWQGRNYTGSR